MSSAAPRIHTRNWLLEHGPRELEQLFRAVVYRPDAARIPAWGEQDALFLLDADHTIVSWHPGAERIYGHSAAETIGQNLAWLYVSEPPLAARLKEEMQRCATEGHIGSEDWCARNDGTRFWGNAITMALHNDEGQLQGFARVVRDFSQQYERGQNVAAARSQTRNLPANPTIAGVVRGEYDEIREANDVFLGMAGYSREDLQAGRIVWSELTPPEYFAMDEQAHEESLCYGACTPFEKELNCKDGTRVRVRVTTAVLQLLPFRWISFFQDLRERDRAESVHHPAAEVRHSSFEEIVGQSAPITRVLGQVEMVAPTNATVLILGETGTGKELMARAVHRMSPRRNFTFISLNCAAIPTGLLESELFGYERGAFTGALSQKIGRFEMAHRGTLFLDEIGDIPLDLQPKLLRALQEKSFERLGGTKTIPIDVRLIAATNRNLAEMMGEKLFRSDLYYRLNVFPILTPALRDHPDDIPALARHFTAKYSREMNRGIETIPTETMRALMAWSWPGNVRELENFIERSVILSKGSSLQAPLGELRHEVSRAAGGQETLEQVEKEHVIRVLRESGGVVSTAAARLGMPRTTLHALMLRLGVSRHDQ